MTQGQDAGSSPAAATRRPPLWLAACAVTAGWGAAYSIVRWVLLYVFAPVHQDMRFTYVAAEAGLRYGWSTIYDGPTLHSLSTSFPSSQQYIGGALTYINPPPLAWIFAPLTTVSEPIAYGLWTVLSLAALGSAWYIAAPYQGLPKFTLLLVALALWPVLLAFYYGQPSIVLFLFVALSWWLLAQERPLAAGGALAAATFIKPQAMALVPLALLVSGRYRPVVAWALACGALGIACAVTLGPSGLMSWWHALQGVQADPAQSTNTLARLFGSGPLTYGLWALQGVGALAIAWRRRRELEIVFAAGILGSAAVAFHFHEWDYTILVLAAWLVLRSGTSKRHRLWLATGIVPMQLMTYGPAAAGLPLIAPQLLWDAVWLAILAAGGLKRSPSAGRSRIAPSEVSSTT